MMQEVVLYPMQMGALALSHVCYPSRTPFVKAVLYRCGIFFALDDKFGPEWASCGCARFLESQIHAPAHQVCAIWLASVRGVRAHHEYVSAFHDAVYGFNFWHVHGFDHGAAFALVFEQSHGYYARQYL